MVLSSMSFVAPAIQPFMRRGDCTYHPLPRFEMMVRLESVDNAFEQANAAALNMLDRPTATERSTHGEYAGLERHGSYPRESEPSTRSSGVVHEKRPDRV